MKSSGVTPGCRPASGLPVGMALCGAPSVLQRPDGTIEVRRDLVANIARIKVGANADFAEVAAAHHRTTPDHPHGTMTARHIVTTGPSPSITFQTGNL